MQFSGQFGGKCVRRLLPMTVPINSDIFSSEVELENFGRRQHHELFRKYVRIKNPGLGGRALCEAENLALPWSKNWI